MVKVLHPVEHPIEARTIGPLERAGVEVEAHLEGEIDLGGFGNAFHDDVDCLVDQRQDRTGRDEARHLEDLDRDLAEQPREIDCPLVDLVRGQLAAHDLDNTGGGDRVKEMHADEAFRVRVLGRELGDREGGGGDDDGVLGRHPTVELAQDLAFEPEVFLHGLEGEIAVGGAVVVGDPSDPRQDRLLLGVGQPESRNLMLERPVELCFCNLDRLGGNLFEIDVDALLGNPGGERSSHHPAADDDNTVQFPTHQRSLSDVSMFVHLFTIF